MKKIGALIVVLSINLVAFSQRQTHYSRSELGFYGGGSYYIGDLNRYQHLMQSHLALGLIYRYAYHSRTVFRCALMYGKVSASDSWSKRDLYYNRNLDFESPVYEFSAGAEFHYFPFQIGHDRYKGTAYLFGSVGLFRMDPYTYLNGEKYRLQPLGTEGQETVLSDKDKYSLTQFCIPFGVGAKLTLWKFGTLGCEFGFRKTFTDYLDDVHSDIYVDAAVLSEQNGPVAGILSNRSRDHNPYGKRGNSVTKDWYAFYGLTLTFKLGSQQNCPTAL